MEKKGMGGIPFIYLKVLERLETMSMDDTLSLQDAREAMSWYRIKKDETKNILGDMEKLGMIEVGRRGIRLLKRVEI